MEADNAREKNYTPEQVLEAQEILDDAMRRHDEAGRGPKDIVHDLPISAMKVILWEIRRLEAKAGETDAA